MIDMNLTYSRLIILNLFLLQALFSNAKNDLVFCGSSENDLYKLLQKENILFKQYEDFDLALKNIKKGSGLIVIADGYPNEKTYFSKRQNDVIKKMKVKLYIEYPLYIPGQSVVKEVYTAKLERAVISSDYFGNELPKMSILGINGANIIPVKIADPIISFAKVAGYDKAQFGLTDTDVYPLLFQVDSVLIATSKLSNYNIARFGPSDSWKVIWETTLSWLVGQSVKFKSWQTDPHPTYSANEILPKDAKKNAVIKGAEWLWNARLFIHPSWEKIMLEKYQSKNGNPNLFFGPAIGKDLLIGDGSSGIMEGHASDINYDGVQKYRYFVRADVQGESAYLLAAAGNLLNNDKYKKTSENLLDYLFYRSEFRGGLKANKDSAVYGLIGWANTHQGVYFNDDNARCILGAIGASSYLGNERWNKFIVENILANLRTSSKQGFQGNSLTEEQIQEKGWKYYNERDFTNPHPHFEAWMWACYLWMYDKTHYKPLLEKAKDGIKITMDAYPNQWISQNGVQQERAKMILPLAWLVRVEDTPEHRMWLDKVVQKLLESQVEIGAIREELGNDASDKNKLNILSNKEYGKNEASLIAKNGDPVSDMLYTCNFAFFALNEAAKATGNPQYKKSVAKLSEFLTRIQVKSNNHIDTDGAWFRAFDYKRWDYWASNADNGWGAWSTLAGWIQTWIVSTLILVETDQSYWDVTKKIEIEKEMNESLWMLE